MPVTRHFIEGSLESDSNVYNVTCSLDDLPSKELFPGKEGRTERHGTTRYIMRCLVERATEFEKAFLPRFENRQALLLKRPENAELDFKQTLEAIWSDGLVNWGRFLAYISFVGAYCLSALNAGKSRGATWVAAKSKLDFKAQLS
ncbi:hypothetical protein ECG_01199 [Echinococcus granulosus]|nr:hypothetical protein ECG_01199 [Echinococcus granulosus]